MHSTASPATCSRSTDRWQESSGISALLPAAARPESTACAARSCSSPIPASPRSTSSGRTRCSPRPAATTSRSPRRQPGRWSPAAGRRSSPTGRLRSVRGAIDTLIVVGGNSAFEAARDPVVRARHRRACVAQPARRVGVHRRVPARRGRPARRAARDDALAGVRAARERGIPRIAVEKDPIFVRDGDVWTSAGVTAGMDLALALGHRRPRPRRRARRTPASS